MEIVNQILSWVGCIAIAGGLEYIVFRLILHISDKRAEKRRKEAELEMLLRKMKQNENN